MARLAGHGHGGMSWPCARPHPCETEGPVAPVTSTFAATSGDSSPIGSIVLLVVLAAGFWFVAIRPGRRRMQAMQAVQSTLEPGRQVVTTAGMYATVAAVDPEEDTVTLEVAPGVNVRFAKGAVMKVVED